MNSENGNYIKLYNKQNDTSKYTGQFNYHNNDGQCVENVLVFDLKSAYPNALRSCNLDITTFDRYEPLELDIYDYIQ